MVLWSLSRSASSLIQFRQSERYVVHVLAASQLPLAKRFAYGSQAQRFNGLALTRALGGTLMLDDTECAAWFDCYNLTHHVAGDHMIYVGQVEHYHCNLNQPLVYHAGHFHFIRSTEPLSST